jgi:SAM-dependent methyltransferase
MPTPDRTFLERVLLRELFLDAATREILFVGCSPYTSWYPYLFVAAPGVRFATIDPDPAAARHGSRREHRVARLEDLAGAADEHGRYDAVVLNGVFNYGIDEPAQKRAALEACAAVLRPGGRLVVGYREGTERDFDPADVDSAVFKRVAVPGTDAPTHDTGSQNNHTFVCLERL